MIKKLLAVLMAISMLAAALPVGVMADGTAYYDDSDMAGVTTYTVGAATYVMTYPTSTAKNVDSAATVKSGDDQIGAGKGSAALYKMQVPKIEAGKVLDTAEFRATSKYTSSRPLTHAYKFPGDTINPESLTVSDMKTYINYSNYASGSYYLCTPKTDTENYLYTFGKDCFVRNRFDVTTYVKKCIAAGQEYFWIAVTRSDNATATYAHDNSTAWRAPKLFYTLADAPELSVTDCSIDSGATDVYPIGSADVTFSDNVASASATINGALVSDSDITINGATVSVAFDLGLSQATTLVVTATDANGTTATHTVDFTTASKYVYYDDSDMVGVSSIKASATYQLIHKAYTNSNTGVTVTEADSSATEITTTGGFSAGTNWAALYKVELPDIPEGKVLDMAQFRVTSQYQSRPLPNAYKFPDNIELSNLTVAEAAGYISSSNLVATNTEDSSYIDGAAYRNRYDVKDYINKCIAAGQEYFWIVVNRSTTVNALSHNEKTAHWQPKLFYRFADAPVVTTPKLVSADATGEYEALADIASISSVAKVKAAAYMANATSSDLSLKVGVAQYCGGELVSISFVPYTLAAGTSGETVFFGASDLQTNVDVVKAFIWYSDYAPVAMKSFSTQS